MLSSYSSGAPHVASNRTLEVLKYGSGDMLIGTLEASNRTLEVLK